MRHSSISIVFILLTISFTICDNQKPEEANLKFLETVTPSSNIPNVTSANLPTVTESKNNTAILPQKQTGLNAVLPQKQTGLNAALPQKQTGLDAVLPKKQTGLDAVLPSVILSSFNNSNFLNVQDIVNQIQKGNISNLENNIQKQFNTSSIPNLPNSIDINSIINNSLNKTKVPDYMKPKNFTNNTNNENNNNKTASDIVPVNNNNTNNNSTLINSPDLIVVIFNQTGSDSNNTKTNSTSTPNVSSSNLNNNFGAAINGSNLTFEYLNSTLNISIISQANLESAKVNLKKNQNFNFTLEGNPTTGYSWYVFNDNNKAINFTNLNQYNSTNSYLANGNLPGSNGLYYFNGKASNLNGTASISFIYKRSWDNEAAKNFTVYTTVN